MSIEADFETAVKAHVSGDAEAARAAYLSIVERDARHAGALSNLGRLARAAGDNATALAYYQAAVETDTAPGEVHFNLAGLLADMKKPEDARRQFDIAAEKSPGLAVIHVKRTRLLRMLQDLDAAMAAVKVGLSYHPENPDLLGEHGRLLAMTGAHRASFAPLEKAVLKGNRDPEIITLLAQRLLEQGKGDQSVGLMQQLIKNEPDNAQHHFNLGYAYRKTGHYIKALAEMDHVKRLAPQFDAVDLERANLLVNCGRPVEARKLFEEQLKVPEKQEKITSGYLMSLLYDPSLSARDIRERHEDLTSSWVCEPRPAARSIPETHKLRVGYLTGDFHGNHPVAQFMMPLVPHHDAMNIEGFAYTNFTERDETSALFEKHTEFRNAWGASDADIARSIEADDLDLLIDLSGHSSANRLRVLGHRPAPVQACFIGYPATTGFKAVDYLITDRNLAPPDYADCYTETLAYLPDAFLCFQPMKGMAPPMEKPARNGEITLGTLNHFPKLNDGVVSAWSEILKRVPNARLRFKCGAFSEPETRQLAASLFAEKGISESRLILDPPSPFEHAMRLYKDIDLALDPFPYNGGTTTCQALWTGTPVVALAGDGFCGRMGASLISAAGHPEWVADSVEGYIETAVRLASDPEHLSELNKSLCRTVPTSPLCDLGPYAEAFGKLCWDMARRTI